jgi:hypothetical protein
MEHTLQYKSIPKFRDYKKRHIDNEYPDELITEDTFNDISQKNCHYCGVTGPNGIDRIDCKKGYHNDNCVPCCKHCNYVKGNLSLEDFEVWANRFVRHQIQKGKTKNPSM